MNFFQKQPTITVLLKSKEKNFIAYPMLKDFILKGSYSKSILQYKTFLHYCIKKGKKFLIENAFRKLLLNWAKSKFRLVKNFNKVLRAAFKNTTPYVSVKSKKKGSKSIYIPFRLTPGRSKYLNAKWLIEGALSKRKNNFFDALLDELTESSLKKSFSVKKYSEMYTLAASNLYNLRR